MAKVKQVVSKIVSFVLGATACMGVCTSGFRDWSGVKKTFHKVEEVYNGFLATATNGHGISLAVASAAEAQSSYTITATVTTDGPALDKGLVWTVAWANGESAWATGKRVTDYVQMTIAADTTNVTVDAKAAFSEPIHVKATSRQNPEKSGTCQLDYVKRVEGIANYSYSAAETTYDVALGETAVFCADVVWGDGTLTPDVSISSFTACFNEDYFRYYGEDDTDIGHAYAGNYLDFDESFSYGSTSYDSADERIYCEFTVNEFSAICTSESAKAYTLDAVYNLLDRFSFFGVFGELRSVYKGVSYGSAYYFVNDKWEDRDNEEWVNDGGFRVVGLADSAERIASVSLDKTNIVF